jgi:hypothetical protein
MQQTSPRLWFGCGLSWLESNCFEKLSKVFREAFQILNVFFTFFHHAFSNPPTILNWWIVYICWVFSNVFQI